MYFKCYIFIMTSSEKTILNTNKKNTDFKCINIIIDIIKKNNIPNWKISVKIPNDKILYTLSDNNSYSLFQIGYYDNFRCIEKHNIAILYGDIFDFIPYTIVYKDNNVIYKPKQDQKVELFINKPSSEYISGGECINVSNTIKKPTCHIKYTYWIAQKLILNPLLINKKKIDLRVHTLVIYNDKNLWCYHFNTNYARSSTQPYSPSADYKKQITNMLAIKDYETKKEHAYYFNKHGIYKIGAKDDDYLYKFKSNINKKIIDMMVKILKPELTYAYEKNKSNKLGYLLLGSDIIIDDEENLFLIEINTRPGLEPVEELFHAYWDELMKHKLFESLIDDGEPPKLNTSIVQYLFGIY